MQYLIKSIDVFCKLSVAFFLTFCFQNISLSNTNPNNLCQELSTELKKGRELMDKNNYTLANSIFSTSISKFKKNKCEENTLLGNLYLGKANLMLLTFMSDSAAHYLDLALRIAEETKNEKFKSRINSAIGIMMNQSGQYEKALTYYRNASATLEELEENPETIRRRAIFSYNLGLTHSNLKNTKEATEQLKEAISFGKEINFNPILIDAHGVLAKVLKAAGDSLWTYHLDTAIELSRGAKDNLKLAQGFLFWANHHFENNDYSETIKSAENALMHLTDSNMNFLKPRIFELLAESNFKLRRFEKSANYHRISKNYKSYYDSINNENITYKFEEKLKFEKAISSEKLNVLILENKLQKLNFSIAISWFLILISVGYFKYKAKSKLWLNAIFQLSIRAKKSQEIKNIDPIFEIWIKASDLLVNEKIYLDKNLNAEQLAKLLGTNLNYLSKAIKTYSSLNFKPYINKLRLEHSKHMILEKKEVEKIDFLEISEKSGFNSIQTFYRVFKNFTGLSPTKWMEENAKK